MKVYKETKNGNFKKMKFPMPIPYKNDFPFLKEGDGLVLAHAQLNVDKVYKNFFWDKSVGFPWFKSKKNLVQSHIKKNQNGTHRFC